ncbi:MAG: PTS sugar transporter subunit IIB [Clostridium sp.]|nr:PTS sugar transporter subunit IIB [Clostridium sp.]
MISMIRIDDRLLHGQIIYSWSGYLKADRIIVANDEVVKNELKMMTLKMAIPANMKCTILSVDDAADLLNDKRCEKLNVLLVIDNAKDSIRIIDKTGCKPLVNVSTYGRKNLNSQDRAAERKEVISNVFLTKDDIKDFQSLLNLGIEIEYRNVPSEKAQDFGQVIKELLVKK